jgi:hypothetical protein
MPIWLTAGLWGLLGASSLLLGAAVAFVLRMPRYATAGIMSFGCGVLISAVAYDLLEDGYQEGGIWPIVAGATPRPMLLPIGRSLGQARIPGSGPGTSRRTPDKAEDWRSQSARSSTEFRKASFWGSGC